MLKCSPEAFAKCPTRRICGNIEAATFTEGSECDLFNQSVMNMPITNADRIRAMSDEELAAFIVETTYICKCCSVVEGCQDVPHVSVCKKNVAKWLQQLAEEVH